MVFTREMAAMEAILFIAGEGVNVSELAHSLNLTESEAEQLLDGMAESYRERGSGLMINRSGGTAYISTSPERAAEVENFLQPVKKQSLTQAVMETLSVIAYRQPATRGEIEAVRGVKCDYSVQVLLKRGLIEEAGERDTLGRPMQYRTTDKFLIHFGIASIDELPDINELQSRLEPVDESTQKGPFEV